MSSSTTSFQMKSSTMPPSASKQPQGPQPQSGGPSGRAVTTVVFHTNNWSVAPGPAWIELLNPAQLSVTSNQVLKIALPPRGAGEYLAHLQLPIAVAIVPPTTLASQAAMIAMQDLQQQQEQQNKKKPPDPKQAEQQKQELQKKMQEAEQEQEKKKEEADKEKEQRKEKEQQEEQKEEQQQAKEFGAEMAAGTVLVPPLSTAQQAAQVAELWLADYKVYGIEDVFGVDESGMSIQGFPGRPRPVSHAAAMPTGLGVNSAKIDTSVSPAELDVTFAGSGSIPARSRWLIFTITGV